MDVLPGFDLACDYYKNPDIEIIFGLDIVRLYVNFRIPTVSTESGRV